MADPLDTLARQEPLAVDPEDLPKGVRVAAIGLLLGVFLGLHEDGLAAAVLLEHLQQPFVEAADLQDGDEAASRLAAVAARRRGILAPASILCSPDALAGCHHFRSAYSPSIACDVDRWQGITFLRVHPSEARAAATCGCASTCGDRPRLRGRKRKKIRGGPLDKTSKIRIIGYKYD